MQLMALPCQPLSHAFPLLSTLLLLLWPTAAISIGVNYGTVADNLPPPAQVAAFLRDRTYIDRVKIFDANADILRAFAGTGVEVMIMAADGDIPSLANSTGAASWVAANVAPFYPATNISLIAVGNEILTSADSNANLIANLVPAMSSLWAALSSAGFPAIRVSTPHSLAILSASEPPSAGQFQQAYNSTVIAPMLQFHRRTKTPFIVSAYPCYGYTNNTLAYALFEPNPGVYDAGSNKTYTNMFAAQLDAVHSAMNRLGYGDVEIVVGETGWPSAEDGFNAAEAAAYNGNLVRMVNSGRGTPLMPNRTIEAYVFALFDEDLKPGLPLERHFGLFHPNFTPVYDVGLLRDPAAPSPSPSPSPSVFGVPNPSLSPSPSSQGGRSPCPSKAGNINFGCSSSSSSMGWASASPPPPTRVTATANSALKHSRWRRLGPCAVGLLLIFSNAGWF